MHYRLSFALDQRLVETLTAVYLNDVERTHKISFCLAVFQIYYTQKRESWH